MSDKYRWHDLRKNPEDLPPLETEVDIVCAIRNDTIRTHGFYEDGTVSEEDSSWLWPDLYCDPKAVWDEEKDCYMIPEGWWEYHHYQEAATDYCDIRDPVIAWRYIEPFEEEE